jgi:microcin C transport system permease protein
VLGSFLLVFFAGYLDAFPLGGFISDDFQTLSLWGKFKDLIHHSILPITCYIMGSFAFVTLLMRNTLADQLSMPFMQAAIARGLSFKQAIIRHGIRNALIPLATDFGQNLTLILSGSFLIETLFDIDGFGLLGYTALLDRDYPIIMGILFLSALLFLLGNLLSDILLAMIDPRIRFH